MFDYILEKFNKEIGAITNSFFVSLGNPYSKANVKYFRKSKNFIEDICSHLKEYEAMTSRKIEWIKIDFVIEQESITCGKLLQEMVNIKRNYIDFGVSFDSEWELSFLPEVINANAFIRPQKGMDHTSLELSENNINHYLKNYTDNGKSFHIEYYIEKNVIKFKTKGFLLTRDRYYELEVSGGSKGIRRSSNLHSEIDSMIETATHYLNKQLKCNGKYRYGYFSHFDRSINFYNILRHCSSTYALIEGLAYMGESITQVEKALEFIHKNAYYDCGDVAYIYDDTSDINEIKLGQNAAYIFAVVEYLKYSEDNTGLLCKAQKVARGILEMINPYTTEIYHVLNYPDLTVKEKNRIIYYEGEAAFALLRLYQCDRDPQWLKVVIKLFDKFISQNYWQYHDHWLSYCTNELVKIVPEVRYLEFGLKNISHYLKFIYHRETTFPTFLEMLTNTYELIEKARLLGWDNIVDNHINEKFLIETLHHRANYQRSGYFYPELSMYFKNPQRILGSFFIKHHGYRVRIDDIEHYLSGYIKYQKLFYANE